MELELKNLGAIKSGRIELKPLTVFIGPNNSGKTWASYAISGLFGHSWRVYRGALMDGYLEETYPEIEQVFETFKTLGTAQINIADYFEEICETYYNNLCKFAPEWMNIIMGTKSKIFHDFSISIDLHEHIPSMKQRIIDTELKFAFPQGTGSEPLVKANKKKGESVLFFHTSEDRSLNEIQPDVLKKYIYGVLLQTVHRAYINDVGYLTAERTGLFPIMSSLSSVGRRRSKDVPVEEKEVEDYICISYPLGAMLKDLIQLMDKRIHDRVSARRNNEKYKPFQELADILEKDILEGRIERKVIRDENIMDYVYRHADAGEIDLEMTVVSSAVKDSSPLSLYLRYILEPEDLILIDEPEMNLHPENQVKMLELLAMLVNLNVNVVLTTHSTYFVDHLVNLMKAAEHSNPDKIRDLFYLKSEKAFISKENVAVYVFEKNTVRSILTDKGFINWDTFSSISQYVANLYPKIAED